MNKWPFLLIFFDIFVCKSIQAKGGLINPAFRCKRIKYCNADDMWRWFISNKYADQGVGAAMAMLWAIANHDPAATVPPYTVDCIRAARDPATGPVTAKPIAPSIVMPR